MPLWAWSSISPAQASEWRCRSFEASADGYGRGEGFAVFILGSATSTAAELSSQPIYVASSAVNQDGRSSGLTAPNGPSQTRLVKAALNAAGLQPQDLAYIAVHGTGKLCQSLPLLPCMKVPSHAGVTAEPAGAQQTFLKKRWWHVLYPILGIDAGVENSRIHYWAVCLLSLSDYLSVTGLLDF